MTTTESVLSTLRSRPGILALGAESPTSITVRVQLPEIWDTLAVRCAADTTVLAMKRAALESFGQHGHPAEDFVLKLRGFEVLNESESVTAAGALEGSTFLLTNRRRRPVR